MRQEFNTRNSLLCDGGKLQALLDKCFSQAVADCIDRPLLEKVRAVTVEWQFMPSTEDSGYCDRVMAQVCVKTKSPEAKTRVYECEVGDGNRLTFNDLSPDNPSQMTIDDI